MKKLIATISLFLMISSVFVLAIDSTEPSAGGGSSGGSVAYPVPEPGDGGSRGSGGGGCSDSDYGFNYYKKGTVKYTSGTSYTDYCKDDKTLVEYSCGRIECKTVEICPEPVEPVLPDPRVYVNYHTESIKTFINGEAQEETVSGFSKNIAEGTHVFLFKKQGYKDCEKSIDFEAGHLITVDVTLQPLNSTEECLLAVAGSSGSSGGGGGSRTCYGRTECNIVDKSREYVCPYGCVNGACVGEKVKETVTCAFKNSEKEQKCYSADAVSSRFSCNGIETCSVEVEGNKWEKITWKSTCGGYAYTKLDGIDDYIKFDCLQVPPKPKPVCGNGICESGEGEVCMNIAQVVCKAGEPCVGAPARCKIICPADCGVVPERPVRLNEKFKLQVRQTAKVTDYKDMEIRFLSIYQGRCIVREIYEEQETKETKAIAATTGSVVESVTETSTQAEEVYPTKVTEVTESEEEGRAIDVDSGQITRCVGGEIIARLAVTIEEEPTKYVSIQLGERKPIFGVTLSFLDYYSKYNIGIFLVSRQIIDCPERCICNADGSMECPAKPECIPGTILCPDGVCRKECSVTTECKFGCLYVESCLPIGTRVEGKYCTINRNLENQLETEESCENNFECKSNVCVDGECISGSLLKKIINWFKRLFS